MSRYFVECTIIYNGGKEVDAEDANSAIEKVKEMIANDNESEVPSSLSLGGVEFNFGEVTSDYAEEID